MMFFEATDHKYHLCNLRTWFSYVPSNTTNKKHIKINEKILRETWCLWGTMKINKVERASKAVHHCVLSTGSWMIILRPIWIGHLFAQPWTSYIIIRWVLLLCHFANMFAGIYMSKTALKNRYHYDCQFYLVHFTISLISRVVKFSHLAWNEKNESLFHLQLCIDVFSVLYETVIPCCIPALTAQYLFSILLCCVKLRSVFLLSTHKFTYIVAEQMTNYFRMQLSVLRKISPDVGSHHCYLQADGLVIKSFNFLVSMNLMLP